MEDRKLREPRERTENISQRQSKNMCVPELGDFNKGSNAPKKRTNSQFQDSKENQSYLPAQEIRYDTPDLRDFNIGSNMHKNIFVFNNIPLTQELVEYSFPTHEKGLPDLETVELRKHKRQRQTSSRRVKKKKKKLEKIESNKRNNAILHVVSMCPKAHNGLHWISPIKQNNNK